MMRNSKYIAMALGAAVLLAGCSGKSPTAPKPTPVPAFNISLTPEASSAQAGESVLVTARVTAGSANAPDNTAVTFIISNGVFVVGVDGSGDVVTATSVVRTTTGGGTSVTVTSNGGTATIEGRVPGDSDQTQIVFTGVAPTPTPTAPPDYTPNIYALTPNAGPFEGGTRVTISGIGFLAPVQVLFDDRQAQVVSTSYTEVVCISPSITPTAPPDVVTAQVTVTNISNGKVSNGVGFRYGVTMFISSFTPMEGPSDTATTVTIFGQGFVAPVSVVTTGGVAWDVLSVAGTEIVVKTKPLDNAHACEGGSVGFTVTNINSNQKYDSPGSFTYRGVHPLITSVQIGAGNLFAQCGGTCPACGTQTITINGSGFQTTSTMTVTLDSAGGGSIGPLVATVTSPNTMTVYVLDASVLVPLTTSCSGGTRNVSTPIDVTVRNVRYGDDCSDRLNGAMVMVPCDTTTCIPVVAPTVASVSPNNGPLSGGTSVIIAGTNFVNSGLSVTFGGAPATGVSFIDANNIQATTPSHTPAGPVAATVFCGGQNGSLPNAFTYTATMDMTIVGTGDVAAAPAPSVGTSPCSSGTCNWTFNQSVVQLTASTTGAFSGWSGSTCGCTGTTTPCNVTMNQNRACTATFTP